MMAVPSAAVHCLALFHFPATLLPLLPPPSAPQGKTLDQTLHEALQPVPNPHSDSGIAQLNRIRESLRLIAGNSTAVGLPQASGGGGDDVVLCGARLGVEIEGEASCCWRLGHFRPGSERCSLPLVAANQLSPPCHLIPHAAHSHSLLPSPFPQPHLDRTRLCELGDSAFEPKYLEKREGLKALLRELAAPKVGQGQGLGCDVHNLGFNPAMWLQRAS